MSQCSHEPLRLHREFRNGKTFWTPSRVLSAISLYPTVYYVYGKGIQPIYIGRSCNLRSRLWSHNDSTVWWPEVLSVSAYCYVSYYDSIYVEEYEIAKARPIYNITMTNRDLLQRAQWATEQQRLVLESLTVYQRTLMEDLARRCPTPLAPRYGLPNNLSARNPRAVAAIEAMLATEPQRRVVALDGHEGSRR